MNTPKFYTGYASEYSEEKQKEYAKQREERGFDDTELWNLDYTLAAFILPRLKAFREEIEDNISVPNSFTMSAHTEKDFEEARSKWHDTLDSMIKAFQNIIDDDEINWKRATQEETRQGLASFGAHFLFLWD